MDPFRKTTVGKHSSLCVCVIHRAESGFRRTFRVEGICFLWIRCWHAPLLWIISGSSGAQLLMTLATSYHPPSLMDKDAHLSECYCAVCFTCLQKTSRVTSGRQRSGERPHHTLRDYGSESASVDRHSLFDISPQHTKSNQWSCGVPWWLKQQYIVWS